MKQALILVYTLVLASRIAAPIPATEKEPAKASIEGSVVKEPSGARPAAG